MELAEARQQGLQFLLPGCVSCVAPLQLGVQRLAHRVGDARAPAGHQLLGHGVHLGVLDVHAHGAAWVEISPQSTLASRGGSALWR